MKNEPKSTKKHLIGIHKKCFSYKPIKVNPALSLKKHKKYVLPMLELCRKGMGKFQMALLIIFSFIPVDTRPRFNVYKTNIRRWRSRIDFLQTLKRHRVSIGITLFSHYSLRAIWTFKMANNINHVIFLVFC